MHQIPGRSLWIGNAREAGETAAVRTCGIRAVVQLAYEEPAVPEPRDLILLRFPIEDGGGNEPALLSLAITSLAALLAQDIPTLATCGAGMSRSPCIAAAALALVEHQPPDECLARVLRDAPGDVSTALWNDVVTLVQRLAWVAPSAGP